ncbi:uncharacterized oxidoreductase TM_0325-like isoform X2 [Sitodiplosis mosellana]|uniref:uncharacterized oxidoreductase TM_0325-like isoform X2 n=1 Tax=Sitodiplosis mosellana TaxID=263140 RepID=UPI00244399B4|nr:uncharacterized oxidoreductase TM_0325-like isoform X2 [Sitodiplosis mosellana]
MSFANKVVLVTGASSGIGAGAAEHLAKKGASVALVGRNERKLNEVCERIKSAGSPTPFVVVADITVDAVRIINETTNHFGQLDILINNAGIQSHNTIENIDLDEYDRIMRTNVRSVIELTKLAVPQLEKTKGNILNVSSSCGLRVKPNLFAYCISKAAVNQLTKSAALDLAPKGFGMSSQQIDEFYAKHSALYPLRRVGEVSDTSAAIEYLVSDHASFITGALLPVDGGALTAGQ